MSNVKTELEKTYHRRFDASLDYRNAVWGVLVRKFFSHYVRASDHVLDLGCGYGQFINQIECARRYAMDLNPASKQMLHNGITFLEQDCSERWPIPSNSLNVVFTSNFLEHLPSKAHLTKTLEEAHRCLGTGGRLLAMGPNAKYVAGAYWDFFDHHIALTELSMLEALEVTGFRSLETIGRFLPFTMVNARRYPLQFVSLYLKVPWLWRWFGGQFLVIVEKP
ncbi:MAG TPA: class I SAM-dependent methyltransferase [Candidatus Angelobacter sp.]|nr:class I SAM-dependent methyltransferase [Candidatus Angelobacter sp.]